MLPRGEKVLTMKKTRQILFLFLLLTSIVYSEPSELVQKDVALRMDDYIAPYVEAKDFSGVILVAQRDKILFEKAYGFADPENKTSNQTTTAFRIASLSKTFTGAAIAMLIEQGKVQADDPINKYLPDFPNGKNILVKHLLLHSSGVGQLSGPEYARTCFSTNELVQRIAKVPPLFEPDSDGQYSNEGYILLAAILEKVSGSSYEAFMQKHFWNPLGMKHTGVMCNQWPIKNHSTGSVSADSKRAVPVPFEEAIPNGPGSIYSTARDLLIWLKALNDDHPIKFSKLPYPYGWGKRDYSGHKLVEQSGQVEGFNSHMSLYSDDRIYFIFLSNIQSGLFNRLPKDFEAVIFGGTPSSPPIAKEISGDPQKLNEYEGAYSNKNIPVPINIEAKDRRLWMHWGEDVFRHPMIQIGTDEFYFRAEYARIKFDRDDQGNITQSSWYWGDSEPLVLTKN
jgi:CubicO group peptidase (beta-lactamase class C family)